MLFTSFVAQAEDYCMELSGGARAVMHVRQTGLSARIQHEIVDQTIASIDRDVMHLIIKDAYTQPLEKTKETKENAIQNFDVYWFLKCQRAQNGFY